MQQRIRFPKYKIGDIAYYVGGVAIYIPPTKVVINNISIEEEIRYWANTPNNVFSFLVLEESLFATVEEAQAHIDLVLSLVKELNVDDEVIVKRFK